MFLTAILSGSPLLDAVEQVESGKNPLARNTASHAIGPLQITPVVVDDINRIYGLKLRHADMTDPHLSRVVFLKYVNHYATPERLGHEVTNRDRALIWRHGPDGWKRKESGYWTRIQNLLTN